MKVSKAERKEVEEFLEDIEKRLEQAKELKQELERLDVSEAEIPEVFDKVSGKFPEEVNSDLIIDRLNDSYHGLDDAVDNLEDIADEVEEFLEAAEDGTEEEVAAEREEEA